VKVQQKYFCPFAGGGDLWKPGAESTNFLAELTEK